MSRRQVSQYAGLSYTLTCEGTGYLRPTMYFAKDSVQLMSEGEGGKYQYNYEYVSIHSIYTVYPFPSE